MITSPSTVSSPMLDGFGHFFEVKLELFDGPLDLLLHLVKLNELPIQELSLAQVAEQYFNCVERAGSIDLELAGEYLVIAATLLSIKSSVLLNLPPPQIEDEEGMMVNAQEEILRRLRELEAFKECAVALSCKKILGIDVFASASRLDEVPNPPPIYEEHDAILLGKAIRKILDRLPPNMPMTFVIDPLPVVERMMKILDRLDKSEKVLTFEELLCHASNQQTNFSPDNNLFDRGIIVSTFIALLELCKRDLIDIKQEQAFDRITISKRGDVKEMLIESSEFDSSNQEAVGDKN